MSPSRIGIEWGFGKVKARCPYITRWEKMKLQEHDVRMYVRNALLLTDIHSIFAGNQTMLAFGVAVMSTADFFA
jgi:hypothetical protein